MSTAATIETPAQPAIPAVPAVVPPVAPVAEAAAPVATPVAPIIPAVADPAKPRGLLSDDPAPAAAGEKPADAPKAEAKPEVGTPEEDIASTLRLPEKTSLDPATLKEVADFAKANKLTKEVAQAILNQRHEVAVKQEATLKGDYNKLYDTFAGEVKADKEFGGEKFQQTVDLAKRGVRKLFTVEERAALEATPFGSHPLLVKAMARFGAMLSEDGNLVAGSAAPQAAQKTAAQLMFPSLYAKK